MIYTADISTLENTFKVDAKPTVLKVTKGLVYRVEVEFALNCAGLAYCVICDGTHQVWPSNPGTWFRGDGSIIGFDDTYLKLIEPFQFDIYTYNLDDTYPHTIIIRIGMVSKDVFMARFLPSYSWKYYKKMLDEMREEEERRRRSEEVGPLTWIEE